MIRSVQQGSNGIAARATKSLMRPGLVQESGLAREDELGNARDGRRQHESFPAPSPPSTPAEALRCGWSAPPRRRGRRAKPSARRATCPSSVTRLLESKLANQRFQNAAAPVPRRQSSIQNPPRAGKARRRPVQETRDLSRRAADPRPPRRIRSAKAATFGRSDGTGSFHAQPRHHHLLGIDVGIVLEDVAPVVLRNRQAQRSSSPASRRGNSRAAAGRTRAASC